MGLPLLVGDLLGGGWGGGEAGGVRGMVKFNSPGFVRVACYSYNNSWLYASRRGRGVRS